LFFLLSHWAYRPVEPQPNSISESQFSSARAEIFLEELVGDSIPHPAGSQQNAVVRSKIIANLESFGYAVEIQTGIGKVNEKVKHRSPDKDEVELSNIIAIRKSQRPESQPKLMLVSHYDSVPTGPGASDDGVATAAVLEVARMMANEPAPDQDVVFLITDGEEMGLLGAKLFVDEHPLAKQIGVVVNLEARGTTGPSCMFETSRLSRILIPLFARVGDKKFASSLFYEIYRRMPNDTDFSVFNQAGILGFNFAFIGDVRHYHTTADNLENVDRGSLQHHGENALGVLRELLRSPETKDLLAASAERRDEAVYFDVFGKWLVWWPQAWSWWLTSLAWLLIAVLVFDVRRQSSQPDKADRAGPTGFFKQLIVQVGIVVAISVVVFLVGIGILNLARLDPRMSHPWPAQPGWLLAGCWLTGFATAGSLVTLSSQRISSAGVWLATCLLWGALAIVTSAISVGASHLFIVPLLIAVGTGIVMRRLAPQGWIVPTCVMTAIGIGLLWVPLERIFYDAVGFKMAGVAAARLAIVTTGLVGLLSKLTAANLFWFSIASAAGAVGSFVLAIVLS
jgi:hypothetical protein